jgi:hypothetical protein
MRPFVLLGAVFGVLLLGSQAQAQLHPCDDCIWDDDGQWAFCLLGGGGPLIDCFQQYETHCSFGALCFQQITSVFGGITGSRSLIGNESVTQRRACDGSAVVRTYTATDAVFRRQALRRITV